jgi:uncharacterized protein (DUF433 family)
MDRIEINPLVCNGRPIVRGTRIAAQTILVGAGDRVEDILAAYPSLTREDALATIQYSSRLMGNSYSVTQIA